MRYDECPLGCTSEAQHNAHMPKPDFVTTDADKVFHDRGNRESLAEYIRHVLGPFNDNNKPVVTLVAELAASRRAAAGWQDISTAPRDGTWILVKCDGDIDEGDDRLISAQWTNNLNGRTTDWHWQFAWFDGGYYGHVEPTHWMPLPAPPKEG